MTYRIRFTKQAQKDVQKLTPKLREKLKVILRRQIAVVPRSIRRHSDKLLGIPLPERLASNAPRSVSLQAF